MTDLESLNDLVGKQVRFSYPTGETSEGVITDVSDITYCVAHEGYGIDA